MIRRPALDVDPRAPIHGVGLSLGPCSSTAPERGHAGCLGLAFMQPTRHARALCFVATLITVTRSARADVVTRPEDDAASADGARVLLPSMHARAGLRSSIEHVFVSQGELGHDGPLAHAPLAFEAGLALGAHVSFGATLAYAPSITLRCTGNPNIAEGCGVPFFRAGLELAGRWAVSQSAEAWAGGGVHGLTARARSFSVAEGDAVAGASVSPHRWSPGAGIDFVGGLDFRRGAARLGPIVTASADAPLGISVGVGWHVTVGN